MLNQRGCIVGTVILPVMIMIRIAKEKLEEELIHPAASTNDANINKDIN